MGKQEQDNMKIQNNCATQKQSRKKYTKQTETKNIILNYRSIMKKILKTSEQINEYKLISKKMQTNTSKSMIKQILCQYPKFQQLLIESINDGAFLRAIIESNMVPKNKIFCLKYLNTLYNSFKDTRFLTKWVDFKPQKRKRTYQKGDKKGQMQSQQEHTIYSSDDIPVSDQGTDFIRNNLLNEEGIAVSDQGTDSTQNSMLNQEEMNGCQSMEKIEEIKQYNIDNEQNDYYEVRMKKRKYNYFGQIEMEYPIGAVGIEQPDFESPFLGY